jgi:ferredoxin
VIDAFVNVLPFSVEQSAAVIAVSGGGEVSPNTASRCRTIRRLKKKGYETVYEAMIVMPPNMMIKISDALSLLLLDILPEKVDEIAIDLSNGMVKRMKAHAYDRIFASMASLEKIGGRKFGKKIKVSSTCKGCGLCATKCPRGNIIMEKGRPVFHDRCVMCLGCIYRCPEKALTPGRWKSFVFDCYDLKPLKNQLAKGDWQRPDDEAIKAMTKGYMLSGIRKYILRDEG